MTSPTDITDRRRDAKKAKRGASRKQLVLKTGTTKPLIKLDRPSPNELK